jgi:hypothetical protein
MTSVKARMCLTDRWAEGARSTLATYTLKLRKNRLSHVAGADFSN